MAITAREIATTITQYVHDETVQVFRNRKLWSILNDRGRISFNNSGKNFQWQVRYRQNDLIGYSDGQTLTFPPQNLWVDASLEYRGYIMTDSIGKKEKLENKGDEALINVFQGMAKRMMEDAKDKLGQEFYVDGNLAANAARFHGIESFLSTSGPSAGNKVGINNDSYAGLSTALAAKGGTWSGTWPSGTGDSNYDYWTPLVVDYTNTGFAASPASWKANCIEALRYGIIKGKKNVNKDGAIDLVMLTDDMYQDFTNAEDDKTMNRISRDDGSSGLWRLGFRDIVNFDGIDITYEYGVPATYGYGLCMGMIEMKSLQPTLIDAEAPFFDINTLADKFALTIFGNLQFEALRNFVAWKPLT
jgi:hypothetical protein